MLKLFYVTARTATHSALFAWFAYSSAEAAEDTASLFDEPCGITVIPEKFLMDQSIRLRRPDEKLSEENPVTNFIFATGSVDAIPLDLGNRRFMAIEAELGMPEPVTDGA